MNIHSLPDHWKYEHFVAFVLLSIADSDHNVEEEELQEIKSRINRIVQDFSKTDEIIIEVKEEVSHLSISEMIAVIDENLTKFLPTVVTRDQLKIDMEETIVSDDSVDTAELEIFRAVKKAMRR